MTTDAQDTATRSTSESDNDNGHKLKEKRKRMLLAFVAILIIAGICYAIWWLVFAGKSVSTDDAYTAVEIADVTPLFSGPVQDVKVVDTQYVHRGDPLVILDATDAKIAVAKARADLDSARRNVSHLIAMDTNLEGQQNYRAAQIQSAQRQLNSARATYEKAVIDEKRRKNLVSDGAVSGQEYTDAQTVLRQATAALGQAQANLKAAQANRVSAHGSRLANLALIENSTIDTNPQVLAAQEHLNQALVNLDRTIIKAPVDGIVSQRSVDVGQYVQFGSQLMSIVPIQHIHVNANFKESQLEHVRPGQRATLTADLYGNNVVYHGWVEGFEGGSGSALSVIPAQNATGNWIKVVQRLPVRIHLDPDELAKHPLRIGLSMDVSIDLTSSDSDQAKE